jgi:hypothetical protein
VHCNENPIYVFLYWEFLGLSPQFPHSCVCERFMYSQNRSTYFLQQNRQIVEIETVATQFPFLRIFFFKFSALILCSVLVSQRGLITKRPTIVFLLGPTNPLPSNTAVLAGGGGGEGVKTTENKIHWSRWGEPLLRPPPPLPTAGFWSDT